MTSPVFGRTNLAVPPIWLSLSVPASTATESAVTSLVGAALEAQVPIDVTSSPALWGGAMRATDAFVTAVGAADYERATDDGHAYDLIQAHLLQTLSAIGREHLDIYYLRVRRAVEEFQIAGALEALEMAKQEGHVRFIGLCSDGPGLAALGMWQFHDAFEVLQVPRSHNCDDDYRTLEPMARERRVGVVTSKPFDWGDGTPFYDVIGTPELVPAVLADLSQDHPVLVPVRSADDVRTATNPIRSDHLLEQLGEAKRRWTAVAKVGSLG